MTDKIIVFDCWKHKLFPEFRAYFGTAAAVASFVNQVIAEANQGYANSQIPITMALHCILDSTVQSNTSFNQMINDFTATSGAT